MKMMENEGDRATNRAAVVLLVQGNPDLLALTKKCLLLQGDLVVETASSTTEALEKMGKTEPDVIVCDVSISSEDIFDFLKRLRENGNGIPFISFAYDDEREIVLKLLDLGANGVIFKSGDAPSVYEGLKRLIVSLTKGSRTGFELL
ncbi:MAG TPA: response regulator [Candidatus Limnocylindrales bacterium]|nr:response regulator [Candidatus Limnocylindrales bacterium]